MYKVDKDNNYISFRVSSDLTHVDKVVEESLEFLGSKNINSYHDFTTVLKELLSNSIKHGNKNDKRKTVVCKIEEIENQQFRIDVADKGNGFEYSKLDFSSEHKESGLPLVNAIAEEISFNENGNQVTVIISSNNETEFDIVNSNGGLEIIPAGNITTSNADSFRSALLKLLESGNATISFNFTNVEDVAAIPLNLIITFGKLFSKEFPDIKINAYNVSSDINNLLTLTKINKFYNITD